MLSNADPRRVVGQCNGRWQTARVVEEKQSSQPSQTERSGQSPAPVGKTNTETKRKSTIVVVARFGNYRFNAGVVGVNIVLGAQALANQSLNRTHCGVPPFGL